jgi:hypothetical protein
MHGERNIAKHLIVGLTYPAVLGTVIYLLIELLGKYFLNGEALKILGNSWEIILLKVILLLTTLVFYGCDFLYTTYTKTFRLLYFVFDIIILAGLFATFKAINYDNVELPQLELILIWFLVFMALYFFWDFYEAKRKNNSDRPAEKAFYKKMVRWELCSFAFFAIILFLCKEEIGNIKTRTVFATFAITISTAVFIWLVRQKRNLYFT